MTRLSPLGKLNLMLGRTTRANPTLLRVLHGMFQVGDDAVRDISATGPWDRPAGERCATVTPGDRLSHFSGQREFAPGRFMRAEGSLNTLLDALEQTDPDGLIWIAFEPSTLTLHNQNPSSAPDAVEALWERLPHHGREEAAFYVYDNIFGSHTRNGLEALGAILARIFKAGPALPPSERYPGSESLRAQDVPVHSPGRESKRRCCNSRTLDYAAR